MNQQGVKKIEDVPKKIQKEVKAILSQQAEM
ncbi:CD1375 family protein [Enterococcus mundtii]